MTTDSLFLVLLDGATAIWLAIVLLWCIRSVLRFGVAPYASLASAHCALSLIPLIIRLLWGVPEFLLLPGIRAAYQDGVTHLLYLIFVGFVPVVFVKIGRAKRQVVHGSLKDQWKAAREELGAYAVFLYVVALAPAAYVAVLPNQEGLLTYAAIATYSLAPDEINSFAVVYKLSYLAVLACGLLLISKKRLFPVALLVAPCMGIAIWLNGKRNIVFFAIVIIALVAAAGNRLRGMKLATFSVALLVGYGLFSQWYQRTYRPSAEGRSMEGTILNYGREPAIWLALHRERIAEPILEYRGQTAIFDLLFFVPRTHWPEKPLPYPLYHTACARGVTLERLTYTITSGMLAEAVSNFGWCGLIVGPVFLGVLARIGHRPERPVLTMFTSLVVVWVLALDIVGFQPVLLCWVVLLAGASQRKRQRMLPRPISNGLHSDCPVR